MTVLTPPRINTRHFTWNAEARLFVAEASDLRDELRLGRVYDDAADIGFTLVSERTGDGQVVAQDGRKVDGEGELLYEDYIPIDRNGHPLRGDALSETGKRVSWKVRIFND